jgi:branched-chain amino acid aminotransferase
MWYPKQENGRVSKLGISRYRRPDPESHPAFAKATGNYLLSKTATLWAAQNGYDDAVLLDREGFVSESLGTEPLHGFGRRSDYAARESVLKGITRDVLMANEYGWFKR